jgi:hypothetical protein
MTSLRKLSAQISRLLSNGSRPQDSTLRDKYLFEEIRQVTHQLIKGEFFEYKNNEGETGVNHLYIGTYPGIQVQEDTHRNRCYALLPAYPMHLPGGIGIYQVKPDTGDIDKDVAMVPVQSGEIELFRSLNAGLEIMKDQWMFFPERDRVVFTEKNNETMLEADIEEVEIQLVVIDPAQVDIDDPYPIPPSMEIEVIKGVLLLHGYTAKEAADMVNDGNPASK